MIPPTDPARQRPEASRQQPATRPHALQRSAPTMSGSVAVFETVNRRGPLKDQIHLLGESMSGALLHHWVTTPRRAAMRMSQCNRCASGFSSRFARCKPIRGGIGLEQFRSGADGDEGRGIRSTLPVCHAGNDARRSNSRTCFDTTLRRAASPGRNRQPDRAASFVERRFFSQHVMIMLREAMRFVANVLQQPQGIGMPAQPQRLVGAREYKFPPPAWPARSRPAA